MEVKRVKDLMLSLDEYATIHAEATVQEALHALDLAQHGLGDKRHHHRAVLVLDDDGQIIGKLSYWAVLRSLDPTLLKKADLESLSRAGLAQEFIESVAQELAAFEPPLEKMCRDAARIKARDAMASLSHRIDEDSTLSQAIHRIVLAHAQSMLVTRGQEIVGILRLSDVFEEVSRLIRSTEGGCDKEKA